MQSNYIGLILIVIISCSCRKKEVKDVLTSEEYFANNFPHCSNGYLDGNELGIDCGGDCFPCNALPSGWCEAGQNYLNFTDGTHFPVLHDTIITIADSMNFFGYLSDTDDEYISLLFYGEPKHMTNYTTVSDIALLDSDHVYIKLVQNIYEAPLIGSGNIFVTIDYPTYYTLRDCDMNFYDEAMPGTSTQARFKLVMD